MKPSNSGLLIYLTLLFARHTFRYEDLTLDQEVLKMYIRSYVCLRSHILPIFFVLDCFSSGTESIIQKVCLKKYILITKMRSTGIDFQLLLTLLFFYCSYETALLISASCWYHRVCIHVQTEYTESSFEFFDQSVTFSFPVVSSDTLIRNSHSADLVIYPIKSTLSVSPVSFSETVLHLFWQINFQLRDSHITRCSHHWKNLQ